jgi:hypothetical protein
MSFQHSLRTVWNEASFKRQGAFTRMAANIAMSLFVRQCAWQHVHPMSGGVGRVRLDSVRELLPLRKGTFGFELAPLPKSLQLPAAESQLNQVLAPRRMPLKVDSLQLANINHDR